MMHFYSITRKENSPVIAKITHRQQAKKRSLSLSELKKQVSYGLLYQNNNQEWRITNKDSSEEVPSGNYIFVRTLTGFTRIVPSANGHHSTLADYKNKVLYAGEITFDKGKLLTWNNRSGSYKPRACFFKQAGLPSECFIPEVGSNIKNETANKQQVPPAPKHRKWFSSKYQLLRIAPTRVFSEPVNSSKPAEPATALPRLTVC